MPNDIKLKIVDDLKQRFKAVYHHDIFDATYEERLQFQRDVLNAVAYFFALDSSSFE